MVASNAFADLSKGGFFMSKNMEKAAQPKLWKRLLFSPKLLQKNHSHRIAYIAVMTAFCVAVNMLEIKLGGVQFSLTICISVLTGMVLGGGAGFCACFLGDLIGFMIHPFGEYSPWIGISTACMALFAGVILYVSGSPKEKMRLKLLAVCLLIFELCTCGITTVYLNQVWFKSMTYWECLSYRLLVQGQIYNSLFNSILVVAGLPLLAKIKALRLFS